MNTSASGGYLTPSAYPDPVQGTALNRFIQQVVVGITGLPGEMVRPDWQPEPPNMPQFGTTWCSFGITNRRSDAVAVNQQLDDGTSALQRHEELDVLCRFYSNTQDRADDICAQLRDGLQVPQNREIFQRNAMALVNASESVAAPSLVKERWLYRSDMTMTLRRQINRQYPVYTIESAKLILDDEVIREEIDVSKH